MRTIKVENLRELFKYDPISGDLGWKPRPRKMFKKEGTYKAWNSRFAGKLTGTSTDKDGYLMTSINSTNYRVHRVCWALYYGKWPSGVIDHINGDIQDNSIRNLRDTSNEENQKNRKIGKNNTSGVLGVSWHKGDSKWMARIWVDKQSKYLGSFTDKQDAIAVRKAAELEYGYHENHGRSA